jgi:hypothetical protein
MTYQFDPILGQGRDGAVSLAEQQKGFDAGSAAAKAAFQSSVSGAAITDAQAQSGSVAGAAIGETRVLSTGVNAGTRVRWYTPIGKSAPVWCWDMYPQSQYQG